MDIAHNLQISEANTYQNQSYTEPRDCQVGPSSKCRDTMKRNAGEKVKDVNPINLIPKTSKAHLSFRDRLLLFRFMAAPLLGLQIVC